LEIITWKQLGLYTHPIIILNTAGYYDPLLQMLQNALDYRFMRDIHAHLWHVAQTPEEVIAALDNIAEWDSSLGKIAVEK
jgi:predicted Rossmann-fold nucleotide-binding protein